MSSPNLQSIEIRSTILTDYNGCQTGVGFGDLDGVLELFVVNKHILYASLFAS